MVIAGTKDVRDLPPCAPLKGHYAGQALASSSSALEKLAHLSAAHAPEASAWPLRAKMMSRRVPGSQQRQSRRGRRGAKLGVKTPRGQKGRAPFRAQGGGKSRLWVTGVSDLHFVSLGVTRGQAGSCLSPEDSVCLHFAEGKKGGSGAEASQPPSVWGKRSWSVQRSAARRPFRAQLQLWKSA